MCTFLREYLELELTDLKSMKSVISVPSVFRYSKVTVSVVVFA